MNEVNKAVSAESRIEKMKRKRDLACRTEGDVDSAPGGKSPFKRRLVEACAPLYHHGKPLAEYAEYGWLKQMDTEVYPYLDEDEMSKAVQRFQIFIQKVSALGFNGIVLGEALHLVTLDRLSIYGQNSPFRIRAERFGKFYQQMMQMAHDLGLGWYVYSDEYSYNNEVEKWMGPICFGNPRFWQYYQEKYRELLSRYPGISGVMIRYGELREYSGYKGVSFKRTVCSCEKCVTLDQEARLRLLVEKTLAVVKGEFSKELIFRTWRPCTGNIHTDPDIYERTFSKVPGEGLTLCMKETMTDFWFYQPHNPTIGIGNKRQMVEFDCARDYEGRGLFPCVLADWWSKSFKYARDKGVEGVWIWPCESGNPNGVNGQPLMFTYFKGFTKWIEANLFLCARLAINPDEAPADILKEWVSQEFGSAVSSELAGILLNSEQAAKKAFYIRDYASQNIWFSCLPVRQAKVCAKHPVPNFPDVRKEDSGNPDCLLPRIYEACRDHLDENIREGYDAFQEAGRDLKLFRSLREKIIDQDLFRAALHSLEHRQALFLVLARYRELFLRYLDKKERGSLKTGAGEIVPLVKALKKSIAEYERDFNVYDFSQVLGFAESIDVLPKKLT